PQQKKLTVEDIYSNPGLKSESLNGLKWFDNGNKFSFLRYDEDGISVYQHEVETGTEAKVIGGNEIKDESGNPVRLSNYEWSPDNKYILVTGLLYARSVKSGGAFYLYNVLNKELQLVIESEDEQVNVQFSPDGKSLGFVRGNNLFVKDIESGKEKQLTFDGSETILNG